MISFTKPTNLNGTELRQELLEAGVSISQNSKSLVVEADGKLYLDIMEKDKEKAGIVVSAHNGNVVQIQPSATEKLAAAGLTVNELKELLGLT